MAIIPLIFSCIVSQTSNTITNLQQTVTPHNDYFSAQFLLSFTTPATYVVMVTTRVVDDTGALWDIGPESLMQVKAVEGNARLRAGSSRIV